MPKIKLLSLLLITLSSSLFAASYDSQFKLGVYASSITYKEPSVMREKGELTGLIGQYSFHQNDQAAMIDIMYSSGDMDYKGSGTIKGIPDRIFELRGLLGRDFNSRNGYRFTPYFGLGYRNLNDDSSYMVSSTNAVGYEREQVYWYLPLGIEFQQMRTLKGWLFGGRVEYDSLLKGVNHTYLSTVPGNSDLTLNQHDGSGFRVSVNFSRPILYETMLSIQPFYRYWHIQESEVVRSGSSDYIEPDNNSREFGVAVMLAF